jgi:hypothetical protein
MFNKSMIALSLAIALGTASAALAENDRDSYGAPAQTSQDIEHARQDIQRQLRSEYHPSNTGNAYGYVASQNQQKDVARSRKKLRNQ